MSLLATPSDSDRATRVDREAGIREVAEFFGPNGSRMFGFMHLPLGRPVGGVVICSPLQAEFVRNYRREVALGRLLAESGVAVRRFHYRGSGNSDGDPAAVTFDSMLEDAVYSADRLVAELGLTKVAFVGTRVGGMIAAKAAGRFDGAALALWEPVLDPATYFREVFRGRLIHDLKEGGAAKRSGQSLLSALHREGSVDILGYSIHRDLYQSASTWRLGAILGEQIRSVLLVQLGGAGKLRSDFVSLVDQLTRNGLMVDTLMVPKQEPWWFGGGGWEVQEEPARKATLVGGTARWLLSQMSSEKRR
jgi:acetyl esterase/lipase